MKSVKDRSALLYILVPLWLAASFGALKAEWISLRFLSAILSDPSQKEGLVLKPIDRLSLKADAAIPAGSRVFFFDPQPVDSPAGGFYAGRLRYQLYQRDLKIIGPGDEFDYRSMSPGDYALFIWPGAPEAIEADLASLVGMEELYRQMDERGSQSIYRVRGER